MCTLSWQLYDDELVLVFNRDEALDRPGALPPARAEQDGVAFVAPADTAGGGTWLLTNAAGLSISLLNDYASPRHTNPASPARRSRGLLVRELAACRDLRSVGAQLRREDLYRYPPFYLLVFAGISAPLAWHWDGAKLRQIIAPEPPFSTSSTAPCLVPARRQRWFNRSTNRHLKTLTWAEQWDLHAAAHPWPASHALAMRRPHRATVSRTLIRITPDQARMIYEDGYPQLTAGEIDQLPMATLPLSLTPGQQRQGGLSPTFAKQPIDVDALLAEKNPALHQSLSTPVLRMLRHVVRESTLNQGIEALGSVSCRHFLERVLYHLGVQASLHPRSAALPDAGERPVFVANHPTGGFDGVLTLAWLLQYYPRVRVVVTDALLHIPHLHPFVVPVDRYRQARASTLNVREAFAGDDALLVFPAGRTGRTRNGHVVDAPWQKMPVVLARQHQRPLVPLHIEGHHSRLFNTVAAVRQRLGISLNLEMLLLARDMLRPPCRHFQLAVDKPLSEQELESLGDNDQARLLRLRQCYEALASRVRTENHPRPPTPSREVTA